MTKIIIDLSPKLEKISKQKICEIKTDSILNSDNLKKLSSHLTKEEKEELLNLKELQEEYCTKIKL